MFDDEIESLGVEIGESFAFQFLRRVVVRKTIEDIALVVDRIRNSSSAEEMSLGKSGRVVSLLTKIEKDWKLLEECVKRNTENDGGS